MDLELGRNTVSSPSQDGVKGPAIGPAPDLSTIPRNEALASPVRAEPPAPTPPGWTGSLPAAFLESERAAGERVAFVSAGWETQSHVRVESASSLVCQLEKVASLPQAQAAGAAGFGVRENGTIVHAATERPAYHRVAPEQRYPPRLQEAVDRHFAEPDRVAAVQPAPFRVDVNDPRQVQGPQGPVVKTEDQLRSFQTAQRQDPRLTPAEFARAQEKSMLCDASYMPALEQRGAIPPYFERATDEALARNPKLVFDSKSGFHAELYRDKRNNTYCLVFRGTDTDTKMDTLRDSLNGNIQALLPSAPQFKQAIALAEGLKAMPEYRSALTEMSGHSLGGALAAAAALVTRTTATTFNAAGLNQATVGKAWNPEVAKDTVRNFRVDGELLTFGQEDLKSGLSAGYEAMGVIAEQQGVLGARLAGRVAGTVVGHIPAAAGTQVTLPALGTDGRPSSNDDLRLGERASRHSSSRVMASMCLSSEHHQ